MRIVFMGTPDFAVESLKTLIENGYDVAGVVTMPDKPAGRGHKLQQSPVKQYALAHGLPVLQPERLKDEAFLAALRTLRADVQVVVAFRMLPEVVWAMPPLGTFNLHASLLPQYRGAAPINWAIINGERETGVTTFFLTHEIDTGRIILQERTPITPTDTAETVHDRLMHLGANLVRRTLDLLQAGRVEAVEQSLFMSSTDTLKPAPKIFKETCEINFAQPVEAVYNFVRGLCPYPAAWTSMTLPGHSAPIILKVYEVEKVPAPPTHVPGTAVPGGKGEVRVPCTDGYVTLRSVQAPGKRRMDMADLLRGLRPE